MKEDFFSKFKDYNGELEKILEYKGFSLDVKNLLLSMFYKLEISYNDYSLVKRKTITKVAYLENVLDNIKATNSIKLIKPSDSDFKELKENSMFSIDLKNKKIKVFANELSLLSALLELNNFQIHLNEEYNLTRNSMPYLLNMAYDMENVEVLRDFNAWSWNCLVQEIKDININLVYQVLKIALNQNIFEMMQKNDEYIDVMKFISEELNKMYSEKISEKFISSILKISIMIYINKSENEKKRLKEEKDILEQELNEIKDKKGYIEKLAQEKKNYMKEVKRIDLVINNKDLLLKEYEKRNKKLNEYNKLFSLSHLVEKMQKERKKLIDKIELCNKKVEPQIYLENKNKLQKDFNLIKDVKFESHNNIYKYIDILQEIFIKEIFLMKIESATEKNELIDCVYQLRYYCFLPYNKEKNIKEVEKLQEYLETAKSLLIQKLYSKKIINTLSTNEKNDVEIVKKIFDLKMINLEYIYLSIRKKENGYTIEFYDEKETLEKKESINLEFNKKDRIKFNRKIKLFI